MMLCLFSFLLDLVLQWDATHFCEGMKVNVLMGTERKSQLLACFCLLTCILLLSESLHVLGRVRREVDADWSEPCTTMLRMNEALKTFHFTAQVCL